MRYTLLARRNTLETNKNELRTKIERVHTARMNVEAFVDAGGDVRSRQAVPIGLELARSCSDLCKEFDQEVLEEMKAK
jgi:hypothetical protein